MGDLTAPRARALAVVLLAAATLIAFAPVLGIQFVDYDDDIYVSANGHVQHGIDAESLGWALTTFYASNWHPVTWLSHMIDWNAYGPSPEGHHVTSLLLHLANVLILFVALLRMTGAPGRSAFAAALFAVHPLHVESVAWLAERKDVLCALFWFLAIAAYPRRIVVVVLAALALMSKPMAVTLPLTLLLLDFWPLRRERPLRTVATTAPMAPLLVLSAASAVLTVMAQQSGQAIATTEAFPFGQRLANAAVACVAYLVKTAWPTKLAAFYPHPGGSLPAWQVAGAVGVLIVITVAAIRVRGTKPYVLFGWLWYLVTLLPVIGLVQVGEQAMADRYTYVPLVGIFVALSWGAKDAVCGIAARWGWRGVPAMVMAAPAIVVVVVLIGLTRSQIRFWHDAGTLFERALEVTEGNGVAHFQLGVFAARQGRLEEADAHFREAVRIHPGDGLAHLGLGTNLIRLQRQAEAMDEFQTALRLDPNDARVRTNLGGVLELQGKPDEAMGQFEEAIRLDPEFVSARIGLGSVLIERERQGDAIKQFREAIRIDPGNAEAHDRIGTALAQLGQTDEALSHFAEAIRLDPARADTQCNWGTALAAQSRYREAAPHFAEAIRLAPANARAHFSMAAAALFLEDYPVAWREARSAQRYGLEPPPDFLSMLSSKMPEPH